ncbi:MAG: DUF120 domain-containing protein [Methanobrevibacter sp.]|nr:DUF120 domain-containing protein [Methanobrevibacter sp.]
MKIKGNITTGLGKGACFLGQDFYKNKFIEKCGFAPFPGTLNIIVPEKHLNDIQKIKTGCNNIINGKDGFGGLKYIKAILSDNSKENNANETINGAIVFPDKTTHDENYLEFIAKENLREKLNLNDDDEVILDIG